MLRFAAKTGGQLRADSSLLSRRCRRAGEEDVVSVCDTRENVVSVCDTRENVVSVCDTRENVVSVFVR